MKIRLSFQRGVALHITTCFFMKKGMIYYFQVQKITFPLGKSGSVVECMMTVNE